MQLLGSAAVGEGILPALQVTLPPPAGDPEQSTEPVLHVSDIEGAQSFTVPPPSTEIDAVSQSPEVPEEQTRHGPLQDVVGICD